ncbi:hypothetical protein ACQP2K_25280 [Microbispora siamensis]
MAGALVLPASALAAPDPAPTRTTGAAAANEVVFTDLGLVDDLSTTSINNKGQVVGESNFHAVLFSEGRVVDLQRIPGDPAYSRAWDVNDDGVVLGSYDGRTKDATRGSFLFKDGDLTVFDLTQPRAVNNKGQVAGGSWIRDQDGSVLKLAAWKGQLVEVSSLNGSGVVAGGADMNPDPKVRDYRAFRTRPGQYAPSC